MVFDSELRDNPQAVVDAVLRHGGLSDSVDVTGVDSAAMHAQYAAQTM